MKWFIVSVVISFALISIWFMFGKMLARAEEGVPFYEPSRTFNNYKYFWQDSQLGSFQPFLFARTPLYGIASFLQHKHLSSPDVQKLIFFFLLLTPLLSVPALSKNLFGNLNPIVGQSAAILYSFNLFVLSQVLQRFIYPLIFLWSFLPLFLYLWNSWLEKRKISYLLILIVTNFLFSDMFGLISSVFALWIPAVIMWARSKRIIIGLLGLFVWTLSNIWWLYPIVSVKKNPYSSNLDAVLQTKSLEDVSKFYPTEEILQLKQNYFFGQDSAWHDIYSRPYSKLIVGLIIILVCVGAVKSLNSSKGKSVVVWFATSLFLVKGANPPLGLETYSFAFDRIPLLTALRNPYEKLGSMYLLSYCLLAALGLSIIPTRLAKTTILIVIAFLLLRPLWTNQIFAGYMTEVPKSYTSANNYLNVQSNLRLLQLPFLLGAGAKYKWGLHGDESADMLFDRPSLSKTFNNPLDPYPEIYKHIRSPNFYKLMQLFSIDSVILHHDVDITNEYQENVPGTLAYLKKWDHVYLEKSLDEVDVYKLDEHYVSQWGYLSNSVRLVSGLQEGLDLVISDPKFNPLLDVFTSNGEINLTRGKLPSLAVKKKSPVKYKFQINNAQTPYLLILSVSHHPNWLARIDGQELKNHFVINGYANGWLVDKKGDYTVEVVFKVWPWD